MPNETTATVLLGPVFSYMGGTGSVLVDTLLVLDEGSRASWRIVDLAGNRPPALVSASAPRNLLAHGLLGYLAASSNDEVLRANPGLRSLVSQGSNGTHFTEVPNAAVGLIVEALGDSVALVVTVLAGSSVRPQEVAQLRRLGARIEETLPIGPPRHNRGAHSAPEPTPTSPERAAASGPRSARP